ncbi:MAG: HAMP domain-containing histidine kinase [Bacteroidetes bacterium]|uniref:histidine kinase n=1 Tax=Candidatus Caccoplasma merdipullorum TaxID=2840718 RepID=A0A9D9H874_9BACT|nr:HAMP domain-containing histidine kinase [Candidatus Caccoplasma merdipullorum]
MKLIYRIVLRLSFVLVPLMVLWGALFYFMLVKEINDEADDSLTSYSEVIIMRVLAGRELPPLNSGSNNSYTIAPVEKAYAETHPGIRYYDTEVFIPELDDMEPARVLSTIFMDRNETYYELTVATPTFEKTDLIRTILFWIFFLYILLLAAIILLVYFVLRRSMQPLYDLLHWLDKYVPGGKVMPLDTATDIPEFRKLNTAALAAAERSERMFEQQKEFIGNASHELQTPLAVLGNRMEWLLDNTLLTEQQAGEVAKMQRTLSGIVRLNRTLLLLTKIENGQFPDSSEVDMAALAVENAELFGEIYGSKKIVCRFVNKMPFRVVINESLASVLVANLIKNAFIYSPDSGVVEIAFTDGSFSVSNDGTAPLDADHIFDRFYKRSEREGATGLGLALVGAIARYYSLKVDYSFVGGRHIFTVLWPR